MNSGGYYSNCDVSKWLPITVISNWKKGSVNPSFFIVLTKTFFLWSEKSNSRFSKKFWSNNFWPGKSEFYFREKLSEYDCLYNPPRKKSDPKFQPLSKILICICSVRNSYFPYFQNSGVLAWVYQRRPTYNLRAPLLLKSMPWTDAIVCRGLGTGNMLSTHFQGNSPSEILGNVYIACHAIWLFD